MWLLLNKVNVHCRGGSQIKEYILYVQLCAKNPVDYLVDDTQIDSGKYSLLY